MFIIERLEGRYEAQEVPFGVVYRWSSECLAVECGCGKRSTLKRTNLLGSRAVVCECGEERIDEDQVVEEVEEVVGQPSEDDEALHPWRYAGNRKGYGLSY